MPDVVFDVWDKYWDPRTHVGQRFRNACETMAAARGLTSWDSVQFQQIQSPQRTRVTIVNANAEPDPPITHYDIADLLRDFGARR